MRTLLTLLLSLIMTQAQADTTDWRTSGTSEEQRTNLVKLIPGTAHWMVEMGARYQNLYWAIQQERWEFAQYQVEEMESLIKTVILARPKRAATAEHFLETAIEPLERALAGRDSKRSNSAFLLLRNECIACHHQNDHGFIVLPVTPAWAPSPVLNLPRP